MSNFRTSEVHSVAVSASNRRMNALAVPHDMRDSKPLVDGVVFVPCAK